VPPLMYAVSDADGLADGDADGLGDEDGEGDGEALGWEEPVLSEAEPATR
jgi:hypothetical protein